VATTDRPAATLLDGQTKSPAGPPAPARAVNRQWLALAGVMLLGFGARLLVGLPQDLEADEATAGLAAWNIMHGQLILMEPNGHYQGALLFYILVPFEAVFGHTQLAIRVGMAAVGAGYVGSMYLLGRWSTDSPSAGILLAAIAAVFPYFAVDFGSRARSGYADDLVLQALLFAYVVKVGWRTPRNRDLAILGLVAGLGLWQSLAFAAPIGVAALLLLLRAPKLDRRSYLAGSRIVGLGWVVGFSPWLLFNLRHDFLSLHSLPSFFIGYLPGVEHFYSDALPIFMGTSGVLPPLITSLMLATVVLLSIGRNHPRPLTSDRDSGWLRRFSPYDGMYLLLVLIVALDTLTRFNGVYLEPRYLVPASVPLAAILFLALRRSFPIRAVAVAVVAAFLVADGITVEGLYTHRSILLTLGGAYTTMHWEADARWLESEHPEAVYADYWLERPIQYVSGGAILMAPYNGAIGFPVTAAEAARVPHPDYLFVAGDPYESWFEHVCALNDVTYTKIVHGDRVLFHHLSRSLLPAAFGWYAV
jgi:4-amino-4-deoxy-L-arabinose transferase-like glycosyltransferase